jgi:hypothetical protein
VASSTTATRVGGSPLPDEGAAREVRAMWGGAGGEGRKGALFFSGACPKGRRCEGDGQAGGTKKRRPLMPIDDLFQLENIPDVFFFACSLLFVFSHSHSHTQRIGR